jgi:hypothetical protein
VLVTIVKENKEGFTDREFTRAEAARRALGLVGYPSPREFKNMVRSNMIKNCTVTPTDIDNAHKVFGADIATLRGKKVRRTQDALLADYVAIPKEIMDLNKEVTLAADVLLINGMPFVTSLSRKVKFATMEYVSSRSEPNLIKSLLKIVKLYKSRGFEPRTTLMDRECECLRIELLGHGVNLNTTAASECVPDIERHIRLIKERARAIRSTMPFKIIPGRMIIEMMAHVVLWLNSYSPRTIMTGTALDFTKHCQIPCGAYTEVHEDKDKTNTMDGRTHPAICLGPTANFQGSYKFLSLRTGKRITHKQFTELPMTDSVVKRVEAMALREKQEKTITFSDRSGNIINDVSDNPDDETVETVARVNDEDEGHDNDDDEGPPITMDQDSTVENDDADRTTGVEQDSTVEDDDADRTTGVDTDGTTDGADRTTGVATEGTTGVSNGENDTTGVAAEEGGTTGVPQDAPTNTEVDDGITQVEVVGSGMSVGTTGVLPKGTTLSDLNEEDDNPPPLGGPRSDDSDIYDDDEDQYDTYHPNTMTPSVQRAHGLRPRKARYYSHMFSHATVMHHAMTQYSLKKGFRKFQKVGEAAVS